MGLLLPDVSGVSTWSRFTIRVRPVGSQHVPWRKCLSPRRRHQRWDMSGGHAIRDGVSLPQHLVSRDGGSDDAPFALKRRPLSPRCHVSSSCRRPLGVASLWQEREHSTKATTRPWFLIQAFTLARLV